MRCHPTKTCYLLVGSKKWKRKVKEELEARPLMFGSFQMKEKDQDVNLGDILKSEGLGAWVEATVKHRMAKVKGAMYEVATIIADHRMQAMGGMQVAWQIWEKVIHHITAGQLRHFGGNDKNCPENTQQSTVSLL